MSLKQSIVSYFLFAVFLAVIAIILPYIFVGVKILTDDFWLIFGFLGGLTFIAYIVAYLGIKRNVEGGILTIMGSITIKLLFSLVFVLIYSLNHNDKDIPFILNYFALYVLFTVVEVYLLLKTLKNA